MPARVVDASVVAAWCFREPQAAGALQLMQGAHLYAPHLMGYELTSVARQKLARYPEQSAAVFEGLNIAFTLPIRWSEVDHPSVLKLASETRLTTYDASYLFLARRLGVPLITFDHNLSRAAKGG